MQRITITIDDALMEELERLIMIKGYQNRSEALRDLARAGMRDANLALGETANCVGVLSYVYDHAARDLARRLATTFHDHHTLTVTSLHVHLNQDQCLEVSILRGNAAELRHFANHVTSERSVIHGELTLIPE